MKGKRYFPPMFFRPLQLAEMRKQVEKKFGETGDYWLRKLSPLKLPDLLAKIRALPMDLKVIREFGHSLSRIESRLLIYEYPYYQEEKLTQKKIILVLISCYRTEIGRKAWDIFQTHVLDDYLPALLKVAFEKEDSSFLGLEAEARQQLSQAFAEPEQVIPALRDLLIHSKRVAEDVLASWKVKQDSVLYHTLLREMLAYGLHDDSLLNREGVSFVRTFLDKLTLEDYKQILKVYIAHRNYQSFHHELMIQAIQKLGDPRHYERAWQFLSGDELRQVKLWVMQHDLQSFFSQIKDNVRFQYWKRYLQYMEEIHHYDEVPVLCMDFGAFVVVEFGRSGAAYFYHKDGFYKVIMNKVEKLRRSYRSLRANERVFKYRKIYWLNGERLYIHSLSHHINWQTRFDQYMLQYLRGNFDFKHY